MNDPRAYNSSQMYSACAVCKHMRRKCEVGCPLAPYFPVQYTREFHAVMSVFGVSRLTKMIFDVDEADRWQLVASLVREAFMRKRDPVLGIYGEYARVWNELLYFKALAHTNSVQIQQLQSQIIRMKSDGNGNGDNSMSVPSDHIQWFPVAHLGEPGAVAVIRNGAFNNNPIHGIPYASNVQNHLQIKNDNREREVVSSATLPQYHPSSIGDDLIRSNLPQVRIL